MYIHKKSSTKLKKDIVNYFLDHGCNLYIIGKKFNRCHTVIGKIISDHYFKESLIKENEGKSLYYYVNE